MAEKKIDKKLARLMDEYYATLAEFDKQYVLHEGATSVAFQSLLGDVARKHHWTLIPQLAAKGKGIRPDATLKDPMGVVSGHWEAKDTDDDLDADIAKHLKAKVEEAHGGGTITEWPVEQHSLDTVCERSFQGHGVKRPGTTGIADTPRPIVDSLRRVPKKDLSRLRLGCGGKRRRPTRTLKFLEKVALINPFGEVRRPKYTSDRISIPGRSKCQSLAIALFFVTACSPTPLVQSGMRTRKTSQTDARPHSLALAGDREMVHVRADELKLPLVVIKGFPFLEGEINGVKGKLLFDTGEKSPFVLNSHRVEPPNGKVIGKGFFGSGQTYSIYQFPLVDDLKLAGGLDFKAVPDVRGNPGIPLEKHITPDFLGWIGLGFFDGYVLKLNYQDPSISFYKDDLNSSGMQSALRGERVLRVVHFDYATNPSLSMIPVRIGKFAFEAAFDTGSHNTLWLTPELVQAMKAEGTLYQVAGDSFTLAGVSIDGHLYELKARVDVTLGKAPFAALAGKPDANIMTLGFEFLRLHTTVWDYRRKTLTFLAR